MSAIKLLKIGTLDNGVERFQSQLRLHTDSVDFIREDGVMKVWDNGPQGFSFYEYTEPYQIVETMEEMQYQPL